MHTRSMIKLERPKYCTFVLHLIYNRQEKVSAMKVTLNIEISSLYSL